MSAERAESGLSERLRELRKAVHGERGRAAFARAIGVSPSTYNYYEKGRQPPASLLAKAAEVTGADLTWLLTGAGGPFPSATAGTADNTLSQAARNVLEGFTADGNTAKAQAARAALRQILAEMDRAFPSEKAAWTPSSAPVKPSAIPIVGRTAAGMPAAWEEFFAGHEDTDALEHLIRRMETRATRRRGAELKAADAAAEPGPARDRTAMLIQLSSPTPEGITEFLELPGLDAPEPGTIALRVDGDSMAPRILDGDLIVCRRGVPPLPGQTAVVKIRDRIGLTVKLWRPEGEYVHLIPINEAYQPGRFLRTAIVWACRVLWVVRL
jgi:SOS-response transcriptional repressor LexA